MATYEEIYGKRVDVLDSDPTLSSAYEGQVWYNSATGTLKSVVASFAFRSTTSLPSGRDYGTGGGATQNASWVAGGEEGASLINTTFNYDGSGWTASGAMGDARIRMPLGNNGPQTAGLGAGGYSPGIVSGVEEYDGTTWTGGTAMPGGLQQAGGAGPQTANIVLGGGNPTTAISYNGSAWAAEGSSSEGFAYYGLAGANSEACLAFYGAESPPGTNRTTGEEYNGTAWTTVVGTLPNQGNSGGAQGTTTSAIFAGNSTTVRSYDGTSIALEPAMAQPRGNGYIGGTATSGITSGGSAPGSTANCEEFDRSITTITPAAWASGTVYPAAYYGMGSSTNGTQNAALGFAGNYPGGFTGNTTTNEYNGSAWTAKPAMSTARAYLCGFGTSTAAVGVGGLVPPGATGSGAVEEFTGTWAGGNPIPQAGWNQGSCGTLTAGIVAFGTNPAYPGQYDKAFEYDGTNWTAITDAPTDTNDAKGMGTQTSALFAGGGPPSPEAKQSYEWNGSTWAAGGALAVDHKAGATLGSSINAGIIAGGHTSPQTGVEGYNGTTWSSRASMATSRGRAGMSGTEAAGVVFGGNPSATDATEEWTGDTETITAKTLTSS